MEQMNGKQIVGVVVTIGAGILAAMKVQSEYKKMVVRVNERLDATHEQVDARIKKEMEEGI